MKGIKKRAHIPAPAPALQVADMVNSRDEIRERTRAELSRILPAAKLDPQILPADLVSKLERACHNFATDTCKAGGHLASYTNPTFLDRYNSVYMKLMNDLPFAYPRLIRGDLTISDLIGNNIHTVCPYANVELTDLADARKNAEIKLKVSHAYTCRKCKGTRTMFSSYQSRASDEASTLLIQCIECGHSWRSS